MGEIYIPKPENTHKHEHNMLVTKQQGNVPSSVLIMNKFAPKYFFLKS